MAPTYARTPARSFAFLVGSLMLLGANVASAQTEPVGKDATVFGYKIHYLEAGRGAPIILLHGTGGEGARWMPTIKALASDFRVIAPDQIGFGASDKPLTNYHSGVFAGFLAGLMKALDIPKATLMGQSMGAGVALSLAARHPQMVDRLILVNGGGFRSAATAARPAPDYHARQIANAGTLAESREYLEKLYFDHSFITDALVEQNMILRLRSAYTIESMQIASDKGLGGVSEDEVRAIAAPTLLVWGANDKLSPPINADKLNAVLKNSRKVLIDRAGHYPFLEQVQQFNSAVMGFLKSQS
jgi:pimeloyl-ACP methyl ester carboxylesterase